MRPISPPLAVHGIRAEVTAPEAVVRLVPAPGWEAVEGLTVPAHVTALYGLGALPRLRSLRYEGRADLLGLGELLAWLAGGAGDDARFLTRIAMDLRSGAPLPPELMVFSAPRMVPFFTLDDYGRLLELMEDVIERSAGYGRQDVCLCALCGGRLKQLEYALCLGYAATPADYEADIAALYSPDRRFSGQERLLYGLSVLEGLSYRDFYALQGDHAYGHLRSMDRYAAFLRQKLPLTDGPQLHARLERLLELGVLDRAGCPEAVELLLSRRLTEAAALLLDRGRQLGAAADPDAEFSL